MVIARRLGRLLAACAVTTGLLFAVTVSANELVVDARTLEASELATIIVTLEGAFAANDFVDLPLQNLAFVGEPYVASEFAWVNDQVTRRKVFRYRVRPLTSGVARVGPVELRSQDGQVDRLAAVELQVLPDRAGSSNDAETVLRELMAMGRDPFFVIAEVSRQTVYAGEPVIVSWVMYNAAVVQEWQVVNVPKLADFWMEELTRKESPERVYVGDVMVQRLPVRRVALYPLRSGRLRVDGLTVEAAIMRRTRGGPFGMFDGELVETTFTSAPIEIDVRAVSDGPPVDAVGDLTLTCEAPLQRGNGPVVIGMTLAGLGNIRGVNAPAFVRAPAGTVQVEGGQVTVEREPHTGLMTRRWKALIFPSRSGPMEIPPLALRVFDPRAGIRRELRCEERTLMVNAVPVPEASPPPAGEESSRRLPWPWLAAGASLLLAAGIAVPRLLGELRIRREARAIVKGATPGQIRQRVAEGVHVPPREASDRGDAWRSLQSLLDAAERERDVAADAGREIERRVRDLLRITGR